MDEDLVTSLDMSEPSVNQIECENGPMENIDTAHITTQYLSNEAFSVLESSISNSFSCEGQLTESLTSPKYCSEAPEDIKQDETKTNIFGCLENGFINEISTENVKEGDETECIPQESNNLQNNATSCSPIQLLTSEDSNKENTVDMEIDTYPDSCTKQTANLSDEIPSSMEMNYQIKQESFEIINGEEMNDTTDNQNQEEEGVVRKNSVEYETEGNDGNVMDNSPATKDNKEEIGRCVDFIKRDMLKLVLKTTNNKYRIKECQIHLEPVEKEGENAGDKDDSILAIKQDEIQCPLGEIEKFVCEGYESYNSKLKQELTSDQNIEYVSVESPRPSSSTSGSSIIMHQDVLVKKASSKRIKARSSPPKTLPPGVAVASNPTERNCKMVLQTLPPYLLKSIVESIKSFSRTDPNSSVPKSIPVQTVIPFKETQHSKENNGFIVLTTGVIERSEPIYYLTKDTTLQDVFGGNVFTVVSHTLPSRMQQYGTPLASPGFIVSPPSSPSHVATLRMTPQQAQKFLISPNATALVTPPLVSPVGYSSQVGVASQAGVASPLGSPAQQQHQQYRAFKSVSKTSPVVRKRGRPPKVQNQQLYSSYEDLNSACPTSPQSDGFGEGKQDQQIDSSRVEKERENGETHCNCCAKNRFAHHDTPSASQEELTDVGDIKPLTTMVDCDDCNKSYNAETVHKCLKKKMAKTANKNLFECPECGRNFSKKAHMNNHMRSHKGFMNTTVKCELCKERFKKGSGIREHRQQFHPETLNACDECDKTYTSQKKLDQHKKIHQKQYDDLPDVVRCVYCNGSFELRHYETVHVQECSDNPTNNISRTNRNVTVSMAKPVAVRSRPFSEGYASSENEGIYEHVEILEEHLENIASMSEESVYEKVQIKRELDETHFTESESEFEDEPPRKQIKLTGTEFRTMLSDSSQYPEEENDIDTDILSEVEENGIDYDNVEDNEVDYLRLDQDGKNYIDVEEMMNDRFSSA